MDKVIGERKIRPNEEQYDPYSSPNIIRVIKSPRIGWVGFVVRMEDRKGAHRVFGGAT